MAQVKKDKESKVPLGKFDFYSIRDVNDLRERGISFEEAYSKLEEIVDLQEKNASSLEESIKQYKVGKILILYCQEILNSAKIEIEKISDE